MRGPLRPADLSLRLASDGIWPPGELSDSYGKNVSGHDSDAAIIGEGAPPEAQEAEVVLVDFATGRRTGGHQEDYLKALETALAGQRTTVLAPFRAGSGKPGRVATYWQEFRAFWRLLGRGDGRRRIIVCHSPEFRDLLLFWLAALLQRRRANAVGLFVLRRSAAGIVGKDNLKARLLEILVPEMIRRGLIHPASDSRLALDHWLVGARRVGGSLLSIPRPVAASEVGPPPRGGPVIGLLGRFRIEKGARCYDAVIGTTLDLFPDATVNVELGSDSVGGAGEIAARLRQIWQGDPRVVLVDGHLTAGAYAALIASSDVVVLPYEMQSYGSGTSGVLHDALALGRTVLATPIAWAAETLSDHPGVVWLTGTDQAALAMGLRAAVTRALAQRRAGASSGRPDTFAEDWQAALAAAAELLHVRGHA
jgi:hypothetical protein